jgi:hypothetical protein
MDNNDDEGMEKNNSNSSTSTQSASQALAVEERK